MTGEIKDGKTVSFGAKCAIWLSCACLYVTQVTPVFYALQMVPAPVRQATSVQSSCCAAWAA